MRGECEWWWVGGSIASSPAPMGIGSFLSFLLSWLPVFLFLGRLTLVIFDCFVRRVSIVSLSTYVDKSVVRVGAMLYCDSVAWLGLRS